MKHCALSKPAFRSRCGDENYLSLAMVNLYEKHKADLKLLKEVFRDFGDKKLYREVFHDKGKDSNYAV